MMMNKIFYKTSEFYNEIVELRANGVHRGENVGFHTLDSLYNRKRGRCTYIYSSPYSGKTEFAFELSLNTAAKYGWITAIYSPETGTKAEVVAKLVFKMTGKQLYGKHTNAIDDETLKQSLDFIESHFIFIDPDAPDIGDEYENALLTLIEFYKSVRQAEKYYAIEIAETIIDPFNELAHNFKADEGRQDLYIERMLGFVRRDAKRYNRHNTIVTHVVDQQIIIKDNIRYYPPAMPRELAGGQAWYRKGDMMISLWRPPFGLADPEGRLYEKNEIWIIVQKVKPEYCGERGTAILYYDRDIGRYYELINGKRYYAFQYANHIKKLEKEHKILIQ